MDGYSFFDEWLENAYNITVGDDNFHDLSPDMQLVETGKKILSLPHEADFSDIAKCLNEKYNIDTLSLPRDNVIEHFLLFAISCPRKMDYVSGIMSLDAELQGHLMQVIKSGLEFYSCANEQTENSVEMYDDDHLNTDNDDDEIFFEVINEQNSPEKSIISSIHNSEAVQFLADVSPVKNHNASNGECKLCSEKCQRIKQLQQELNSRIAEEQETIAKLRESMHVQSSNAVNAELETIDLQRELDEKNRSLAECTKRIQDLEAEVAASAQLKTEVLELRDQLDVLRPIAERLDSSEAKNEKLKSRLEELRDVKAQLSAEYDKHSETFSRLTTLEAEAEGLRKLKPQLDQYRAQYAETCITVDELRLRLASKEEELVRLQRANESLAGGQDGTLRQTHNLMEELRESQERLREAERVGGVGEGMNEMNSAVMQELARLRNENRDLTAKLSDSALDELDRLRKDLGDQQCISASLQKKLLSTKDALQTALAEIQVLTAGLRTSESNLDALASRFTESMAMAAADLASLANRHTRDTEQLVAEHDDFVARLNDAHATVERDLGESLAEFKLRLANSQDTVTELRASVAQLEADCVRMTAELCAADEERVRLCETHGNTISEMQQSFDAALSQHISEAASERSALATEHLVALEAEARKIEALTADLEEEVSKRRKVDRVRKFFEGEAARLKTQLAVACNASASGIGGQDLETAISEMRLMQQQLDEAHAEIAHLRAASVSNEYYASVQDAGSAAGGSVLRGPLRATRRQSAMAVADERDLSISGTSAAHGSVALSSSAAGGNAYGYANYLEQAELAEKRIEALTRERREMLGKSLEENKEKMELSQRLLVSEKRVAALEQDLRRLTLEKARAERQLQKAVGAGTASVSDENVANQQLI